MWTVDQNVYNLPQIPGLFEMLKPLKMFLLGLKLSHKRPLLAFSGFQLEFY